MTERPHYILHHPKLHRRTMSAWWWLGNWMFTKFALRELTCVSVGYIATLLLLQLHALGRGPKAYIDFLEMMKSPLFIVLNGVAFPLVLYHALTWFHLTPKALVIRLRGMRVPDSLIITLNYLVWIILSLAVIVIVGG